MFKVDPTTSQINRLLNELENVEEGSQQEKALLNQLNKYTVDEQTESILRTTLLQIIDVESRRIIEADISQENQLDTPRFTNLNEWFAFTVKAQKDAVDYYKNQLD